VDRLLALSILLASAPAVSAEPSFEAAAICRTAIASLMGRDPRLLQTSGAADGVVVLTYARPIDNFVWTYRCRIEGDRVIWADEPGRWRQGAKDDKVSFEVLSAGTQLRIIATHADGSTTRLLFDREMILQR
jgi:hypothetical protein